MYDLAIIGGGMAGASLACGLSGRNLTIAVIEPRPPGAAQESSYDDRGIALSWSSRTLFDELGLWSTLATKACPIERIHVSAQGRCGGVKLDAGTVGLEALGFVVSARELGHALYAALGECDDVELLCPAMATAVAPARDRVEVSLERDGAPMALRCRLLVVADGGSALTRAMGELTTRTRAYQQTAIVGNVTLSRPHCNTAYERFTPAGLIALLPQGVDRCATVITVAQDRAQDYLQASDADYLTRLQQRFGRRLGCFSRLGARKPYPLALRKPIRQTGARMALLGNAAHTIHPNGAQGLNLSLRDVAALIATLDAAQRAGADPGSARLLADYARSRRADQRQVMWFTDALCRAFSHWNPLITPVCNAAMFALDAAPVLKKTFIRRATGIALPAGAGLPSLT